MFRPEIKSLATELKTMKSGKGILLDEHVIKKPESSSSESEESEDESDANSGQHNTSRGAASAPTMAASEEPLAISKDGTPLTVEELFENLQVMRAQLNSLWEQGTDIDGKIEKISASLEEVSDWLKKSERKRRASENGETSESATPIKKKSAAVLMEEAITGCLAKASNSAIGMNRSRLRQMVAQEMAADEKNDYYRKKLNDNLKLMTVANKIVCDKETGCYRLP